MSQPNRTSKASSADKTTHGHSNSWESLRHPGETAPTREGTPAPSSTPKLIPRSAAGRLPQKVIEPWGGAFNVWPGRFGIFVSTGGDLLRILPTPRGGFYDRGVYTHYCGGSIVRRVRRVTPSIDIRVSYSICETLQASAARVISFRPTVSCVAQLLLVIFWHLTPCTILYIPQRSGMFRFGRRRIGRCRRNDRCVCGTVYPPLLNEVEVEVEVEVCAGLRLRCYSRRSARPNGHSRRTKTARGVAAEPHVGTAQSRRRKRRGLG